MSEKNKQNNKSGSLKKDAQASSGAPLQEGIDFYMEDGLFVLTAVYLKRRGYCCGNGCRHCPYQGTPEYRESNKH